MNNEFNVFAEMDVESLFSEIKSRIKSKIENEPEHYLQNVEEEGYVNYLKSEYMIEVPVLDFEQMYIDIYEKQIPADKFPWGFNVSEGRSYPKLVIIYHIPFSGKSELFRYKPNSGWMMWTTKTFFRDNALCFEIINFRDNSEDIKKGAKEIIDPMRNNYASLKRDLNSFNDNLDEYIKATIAQVKQKYTKNENLKLSLGIPFKKRVNIPETFAVPKPRTREKIIVSKPVVTKEVFKPEPTLNQEDYQNILKIINDVGKNFERMPSTFKDKDEESLRDHILLVLEPNFEGGTATGETFNKSGKTDILLRYESSNVFVAECKFWKGEKGYLETIDQLLRYLTWRDSKTAIIIFSKNKDLSNVLEQITLATEKHSNYKGFLNKTSDTWFNYNFHLNGDINREIKLAVMVFHLVDL